MTPCDKNNILHALDSRAMILSDFDTAMDVFDYPIRKVAKGDRIFTLCPAREKHQSAGLP
jgi:hypothetical protein